MSEKRREKQDKQGRGVGVRNSPDLYCKLLHKE